MAVLAISYVGHSIVVLVLWIGIACLTRGIAAIALGFMLRSVRP